MTNDDNYQHLASINDSIEEAYKNNEDFLDFFTDHLYDIRYVVTSDKEYYAVKLLIAVGGPDIWLDTESRSLKLYWWGSKAEYPIDKSISDAIDESFKELYDCA